MGSFRFDLRQKIIIGSLFATIASMVIGGFGIWKIDKVMRLYRQVSEENLVNIQLEYTMQASFHQVMEAFSRIVNAEISKSSFSSEVKEVESSLKEIASTAPAYEAQPNFIEGEKEAWMALKPLLLEELPKISSIIMKKAASGVGRAEAHRLFLRDLNELSKKIEDGFLILESFQWRSAGENTIQAKEQMSTISWMIPSLLGGAVVVCSALIWFLANSVFVSLSRAGETLFGVVDHVKTASGDISKSSHDLSKSTTEQASAVEEISSTLAEISQMALLNVEGAERVDKSAKTAYQISDSTSKSMSQLMEAMESIRQSNDQINKLVDVIREIGEKTEVIDEIVFKTQLLSFNASVEAERAGEHGRGFSVVAQEVGNLAQMSGKAALEISTIVKNSIQEAGQIASKNKQKVDAGSAMANDTQKDMLQVIEMLSKIIVSTGEIVVASKEQGTGIQQVNKSVELINNNIQTSVTMAQQLAEAGTDIQGQSQSLAQLAGSLRRLILGRAEVGQTINTEVKSQV